MIPGLQVLCHNQLKNEISCSKLKMRSNFSPKLEKKKYPTIDDF